ncbi:hypothetical protein K438DRAFT_1946861 [Mycena galopus ATCC 62051]|nr:hypothetical protein K438DRAFT_1946861 [Mycena galopus ATCC 62051]
MARERLGNICVHLHTVSRSPSARASRSGPSSISRPATGHTARMRESLRCLGASCAGILRDSRPQSDVSLRGQLDQRGRPVCDTREPSGAALVFAVSSLPAHPAISMGWAAHIGPFECCVSQRQPDTQNDPARAWMLRYAASTGQPLHLCPHCRLSPQAWGYARCSPQEHASQQQPATWASQFYGARRLRAMPHHLCCVSALCGRPRQGRATPPAGAEPGKLNVGTAQHLLLAMRQEYCEGAGPPQRSWARRTTCEGDAPNRNAGRACMRWKMKRKRGGRILQISSQSPNLIQAKEQRGTELSHSPGQILSNSRKLDEIRVITESKSRMDQVLSQPVQCNDKDSELDEDDRGRGWKVSHPLSDFPFLSFLKPSGLLLELLMMIGTLGDGEKGVPIEESKSWYQSEFPVESKANSIAKPRMDSSSSISSRSIYYSSFTV